MAFALLPAPGKKIRDPRNRRKWLEIGPCITICTHRECEETRETAESPCTKCSAPIGYETPFFTDPESNGRYMHMQCLNREVA